MAAPLVQDFLTPVQLTEKYPVSLSMIYSACQQSLLSHYRIPAKRGKRGKYLIRESEFLAWLETHRHEAGDVEEEGELTHIR